MRLLFELLTDTVTFAMSVLCGLFVAAALLGMPEARSLLVAALCIVAVWAFLIGCFLLGYVSRVVYELWSR